MQIRLKLYLFFPTHNGHFFDSCCAFNLVQLRNPEYGCKLDFIISKVLLDSFKSLILQKELREISVGGYFQAETSPIVRCVCVLGLVFFIFPCKEDALLFLLKFYVLLPMLLHHSKLSSLASCLAFDWLLAPANSHKSENLVKYIH